MDEEIREETSTEITPSFCELEIAESTKTILSIANSLPELANNYRTALGKNPKIDQINLAELHHAAKSLWNVFPELLQNLNEYGDEEICKVTMKLFVALKQFDYLGKGNYDALKNTLISFTELLPKPESNINAGNAAHLMNRIKMGYFPTDLEHVRLIKSAVKFPKNKVNVFDPCCGEGMALKSFTQGENADTYGIELDEARGHNAGSRLLRVGLGNYFSSQISFYCFHALFLNPPYVSAPSSQGGSRRMERAFLSDSIYRLMNGGLLVYIIPFHRATESVCKTLAYHFKDIRVYKFRDDEFKKYKQIVFFGIRRNKVEDDETAAKLFRTVLNPNAIPLIDTLPKGIYELPDKECEVKTFKGAVFDVAELENQLSHSDSLNLVFSRQKLESRVRNPLLPLNLSQIGLVGASGLMNGLVECEHPHVIKGRIIKHKTTEKIDRGKEGVEEIHETVTNKMIFNILTPDGFISVS